MGGLEPASTGTASRPVPTMPAANSSPASSPASGRSAWAACRRRRLDRPGRAQSHRRRCHDGEHHHPRRSRPRRPPASPPGARGPQGGGVRPAPRPPRRPARRTGRGKWWCRTRPVARPGWPSPANAGHQGVGQDGRPVDMDDGQHADIRQQRQRQPPQHPGITVVGNADLQHDHHQGERDRGQRLRHRDQQPGRGCHRGDVGADIEGAGHRDQHCRPEQNGAGETLAKQRGQALAGHQAKAGGGLLDRHRPAGWPASSTAARTRTPPPWE